MNEERIKQTKAWRLALDGQLQEIKAAQNQSRERSLAITKLQEAIMWLGLDLKEMAGGKSCYEHGKDPESAEVEPTADGVGL